MRLNRWLSVHQSELWTFTICAGFAAALTGLGIASEGAVRSYRASVQDNWPVATGVIVRVDDRTDRVANGQPADSRVAVYSFQLDGKQLVGDQSIAIPSFDWTLGARESDLLALRPGACQVHYNPENPAESWIWREDSRSDSILLGALFAALGLVVAFVGWKMRNEAVRLVGEEHGADSLHKEPPGIKRWEVGVFGIS
ncbi:MAG: DUF3592 domain-containing protein [Planctomycetes bacterium]|nr:DUF3592 domain-containing protein [Planctomycetota bacterium]